jgi:iron(III) transport system permease protein
MVIQAMTYDEGAFGYNMNATGRRCASTVFIMMLSGLVLWLVYGVGARDLGERLENRKKWKARFAKLTGRKKKDKQETAA